MTYDYKAQAADPQAGATNPYRMENMFLWMGGAAFLLAAIMGLFQARDFIQAGQHVWAALAVLMTACLGVMGAQWIRQGLSQMQFWIGQNHPANLPDAQQLTEQLRKQVVSFSEPSGWINSVLYKLMTRLHLAPEPLQNVVQQRFATLVKASMLCVSLTLSCFLFAGHPHEGLMSIIYLFLAGISLLELLERTAVRPFFQKADDTHLHVALLIVFSVLASALLPQALAHVPVAANLPVFWWPAFVMLLGAMLNCGLFLRASALQKDVTEHTAVACETHTLDLQCPATQVWSEIEREFQRQWVNDVPNRSYRNHSPDADPKQGSRFSGQILEESQPQWEHKAVIQHLHEAWSHQQSAWLVIVGFWGVFLAVVGAVLSTRWVYGLSTSGLQANVSGAAVVLTLWVQAHAALQGCHFLWSRLYFRSRVTWIELNGTQQQSEFEVGNTVQGHVRSRSKVTRIQNATLRVWSADIQSVTYGKDGQRCVVSMSPARETVQHLVLKLMAFAQDQSVLVSPSAPTDQQRMLELAKLNQQLQQSLAQSIQPRLA